VSATLFVTARKEFEAEKDPESPGRPAFGEQYERAMEALRTPRLVEVEDTIRETTRRMLGFLGPSASSDVEVGFGFADPANPFASLRINYTEDGMTLPGEEVGMDVQSAIVVGIFEALRRLGSPVQTVLIEEPEMFLHPQAQRYFYRLLNDLVADGTQVIYSTHSAVFADVDNYEGIRLLRRRGHGHTVADWVRDPLDAAFLDEHRKQQRLATGFDSSKNELFFADRALLVEGPADMLAVMMAAKKLDIDLDAENVAVVQGGGKTGLLFYGTICRALSIPYAVMHDEDIWPEI
jgi:putative ATP-dependent endonuclease of OLD family